MKKRISWILVIFMLLASFQYAARIEEMAACAVGRQAAEGGWRLSGRMLPARQEDCRNEPKYENLFGRAAALAGSGFRAARGVQILLGLIVFGLLVIAGGKSRRRRVPPLREPVRMRAVRHIHFAYGL